MREPTEMELRVASALNPYMYEPTLVESDYIDAARAAIRAMREPTMEMACEGVQNFTLQKEPISATVDAWQAMIDAASPPDSGEGQ